VGHVECIRDIRMHTKFLSDNLKGTDHMEDLGIDGKVILEWILRSGMGRCGGLDSFTSGKGPVVGLVNTEMSFWVS